MNLGELTVEDFAAHLVGLDTSAGSAKTLTGLFRKLRDDEFLPDPLTHQAMLTVAGRRFDSDSLLTQDWRHARERWRSEEAERFAAEFFSIPVAERAERWNALVKACAFKPRLLERLGDLKPGLTIDARLADDPSPLVKRLLNDILTIFPLRLSAKAGETRRRSERFLAEPGWTDADRAKAVKQLRKSHGEIASIAEPFLARISRPRKPTRHKPVKPPKPVQVASSDSGNSRALVTIAVVIVASLSRLVGSHSTPRPAPSYSAPSNQEIVSRVVSQSGKAPIQWPPGPKPGPNLVVRDELKPKIRAEIVRLGRTITDDQLDGVLAGLPWYILPNVGGMASVRLMGAWTDPIHARFVSALREALQATDLELSDSELDDLMVSCLPAPPSASARAQPTSRPTSP